MYVSLCTKAYRKTKVTDVLGNNNFTDMFLIFFSRIGLQVGKSLCVHVCLCVMSGEDEKKKSSSVKGPLVLLSDGYYG